MNSSEERLKEAVGRLLGTILLPFDFERELSEALTASETTDMERLVGWLTKRVKSYKGRTHPPDKQSSMSVSPVRVQEAQIILDHIAEELGGDDETNRD